MAEIVKRIVVHNDGDFPGFSPGTAPRIEICTCKRYSDGKLASGCDTSKCPNADHRAIRSGALIPVNNRHNKEV